MNSAGPLSELKMEQISKTEKNKKTKTNTGESFYTMKVHESYSIEIKPITIESQFFKCIWGPHSSLWGISLITF